MEAGKALMAAWAGIVFFVSASFFSTLIKAFVVVEEPWQARLVSSNVSYALALFFLLLLILGHGLLSAGGVRSGKTNSLYHIYRSLLMPLFVAGAVIFQFPLVYAISSGLETGDVVLILVWLALVSDPSNRVGSAIARSDWFRTKILKSGQSKQTGMFGGLEGKTGIVVFHGALLLLFLAGFLARA